MQTESKAKFGDMFHHIAYITNRQTLDQGRKRRHVSNIWEAYMQVRKEKTRPRPNVVSKTAMGTEGRFDVQAARYITMFHDTKHGIRADV